MFEIGSRAGTPLSTDLVASKRAQIGEHDRYKHEHVPQLMTVSADIEFTGIVAFGASA